MALPSFLQAMFTPQRSGPGQMAWRDVVNEDSGEFSTGDTQEMYWKRGAAAPGHGQQMTSAVRPQDGMGQTAAQDIQDAISKIVPGTDGGGMDDVSIIEVMQTSTPTGMAGEMSVQGPSPFSMRDTSAEEGPGMVSHSPMGGWADQGDPGMVTGPMFMPSELSVKPLLDPMGSGIGGVRASDQTLAPPMGSGGAEFNTGNVPTPLHLNIADQVGTGGSRSQIRQDRANTIADELAFGARADARNMRKQPPGFWDWMTGGAFGGPSQYMPSEWDVDVPGQRKALHGIDAQLSARDEERKIAEDRENLLRAQGVPEYKIRRTMGQFYTGPMTEGAL